MKKFKDRWQKFSWETRLLITFGAIAAFPLLLGLWPKAATLSPQSARESMDTHIPKGFVLIPINVQNYEALDSILGRYGIVDLFKAGDKGVEQQPLARNVRLLRAPNNPIHFAALVPEVASPRILSHSGSYVVVVKRPGTDPGGIEFVKSQVTRRKIIYGGNK